MEKLTFGALVFMFLLGLLIGCILGAAFYAHFVANDNTETIRTETKIIRECENKIIVQDPTYCENLARDYKAIKRAFS